MKKALARRRSIVIVYTIDNKFKQAWTFSFRVLIVFSTTKHISTVVLEVFERQEHHTIIRQLIRQFHWVATKVTSKNFLNFFGKTTDWRKNMSSSQIFLHGCNNFQGSTNIFNIFNNSTLTLKRIHNISMIYIYTYYNI